VRAKVNIDEVLIWRQLQSELLGQFRLISDRASDVSGGRICLTQNAYAELLFLRKPTKAVRRLRTYHYWKINTILVYSSLLYSILFYSYLNILKNTQSELLGQFRLTGDCAKYSMYIAFNTQMVTSLCDK